MNLFPAVRFEMANWIYYSVKMTMRQLADNVKFAAEVYEDRTLDEAIQRALNDVRVKKQIVTYLQRQPDRFFSSVVVATLGGDPKFYPVQISDDPRFDLFREDRRLNETFGVLKFDGTQDYYALDGQHRLAAIKTLLDREQEYFENAPPGFADDEMSVIVVVQRHEEAEDSFLRRYRRLFSHLNRYAKPMDQATNIIMDEDDTFSIVTRRLITDHDFFKWTGRHRESPRIKTEKGKNLKSSDSFFTSIETLYEMNISLLNSRSRQNRGWGDSEAREGLEEFKRFRPEDEVIDRLEAELRMYWDGLVSEIPDLARDPAMMRAHSVDDEASDVTDHLLFWPIGQEMLADLARDLLDERLPNPDSPTRTDVEVALRGLGSAEWRLHQPPWRYFVLIQDDRTKKWTMRSEERAEVMRIARRIQRWVLGFEEDEEEVDDLFHRWSARLIPNQSDAVERKMWAEVEAQREVVARLSHV